MGTFKLGKMTLRSLFHKPATVRYPYEKRDLETLLPHMRGHVVNDIDTCILCGMCQRACPVDAIVVDRKGGDWTIDPYRCVQCASCVRECPKDCLSMGILPTEPTTELTTVTMHKDMPAKPAAKAGAKGAAGKAAGAGAKAAGAGAAKPKRELTPEQQARVEAARKAAAAKKAAKAAEAGEAKPAAAPADAPAKADAAGAAANAAGAAPAATDAPVDDRAAKMEAKLAAMDPEKAAKVRAALAARQAK